MRISDWSSDVCSSDLTIADTARVLSRYVDAIMIRTSDHDNLTELAEYATVPVINGLTDRSHPCPFMADVITFEEHQGPIKISEELRVGHEGVSQFNF